MNHSNIFTLLYISCIMFSLNSCFHLFLKLLYISFESPWTLVEWNSCWVKLTSLDLDLRPSADSGARLPEQSDGDLDQHTISLSQLATWKIIFLISVFLYHQISYLSISKIFCNRKAHPLETLRAHWQSYGDLDWHTSPCDSLQFHNLWHKEKTLCFCILPQCEHAKNETD